MSEIYLTKIERKTIFTKALIFVLLMCVISDLTVTGPFYFNFIPWMYIVGLFGSVKKIDSILMCVIGTFNVFISALIIQGGVDFFVVMTTAVTLVTLILGIITGRMIFEFILEHRLVKYIKRSKKIMYIVTMIIMLLSSWVMVGLNSGNIFTYLKSKNNLEKYIEKTYGDVEYTVNKVKHNIYVPGKYTYMVNIGEQEVDFVPLTESIFKDANKSTRYIKAQHELETSVFGKVEPVLDRYLAIKNAKVEYKVDYNSFDVNSVQTVMSIEYMSQTQEEANIYNVYEEISSLIKELQGVYRAQTIIVNINGNILQMSEDDVHKLTADYIQGGFEVEEISD